MTPEGADITHINGHSVNRETSEERIKQLCEEEHITNITVAMTTQILKGGGKDRIMNNHKNTRVKMDDKPARRRPRHNLTLFSHYTTYKIKT